MARTVASVDISKNPLELTVIRPPLRVDVTVLGETVTVDGSFAIKVVDAERTWTLKSDNGTVALYTAAV